MNDNRIISFVNYKIQKITVKDVKSRNSKKEKLLNLPNQ